MRISHLNSVEPTIVIFSIYRKQRPKIDGLIEVPHLKYGSAIFAKFYLAMPSAIKTIEHGTEVLAIEGDTLTIISLYKTPGETFILNCTNNNDCAGRFGLFHKPQKITLKTHATLNNYQLGKAVESVLEKR